ncbi:MAG: recombinase RecT, partial [Planctomycetes bacterium]|nr:recombinase RecT [Planctomycetota bacterium]
MSTKQLQAANGGHQELMVEFGAQLGLDPQALGQTLAKTIFPNATATKEQVFALLLVAKRYNLDPILKQIFAFPAKGGGIIPIVGYDGFCGLANAHPQFDGVKTDPIMDENGKQIGCTAKVWRKDRTHPVELTEWVSECSTGSGPWKKSPGRMIRNRAVTQAFRLAFSFSGIHLADEAEQIRDAQFSVKEG